ncbi:MAG TPA: glycosyltransferase family 2 protein [Verrucomicrobiae bacterium]|nr:glycosyltransferase family 2 protein [Verrucomicrobiae bacterium]
MNIVTVVPAYNEGKRIGAVLSQFPTSIAGHEVSVIVVDDGSTDTTSQVVKEIRNINSRIHLLRHRTNLGKGAAAKTGCDAAYKMGADVIVLMDADGQHRVEDLEAMVAPLLTVEEGLVVGSRQHSGEMPIMMRVGNKVLSHSSKMMFGIQARDTQSGYRAFTAKTYPKIRWVASQYAMETEMLILAVSNKIPVFEVGIPTIYLDNHKGTTPLDGIRILNTLFSWKFRIVQQTPEVDHLLLTHR